MTKQSENKPGRPFWDGFFDVFGRTFSLDFSSHLPPPPPPSRTDADGFRRDAENLRRDWENGGGYLRNAMDQAGALTATHP